MLVAQNAIREPSEIQYINDRNNGTRVRKRDCTRFMPLDGLVGGLSLTCLQKHAYKLGLWKGWRALVIPVLPEDQHRYPVSEWQKNAVVYEA
jgi:hypothetical protein